MATVRVIDLVGRVETILQDDGTRWPRLEIQDWLNEAYLSLLVARPDANALTGTHTCSTGVRQDITDTYPQALRILDVTRNTASGSSKRVTRLVSRSTLDDQAPTWYDDTGSINIQHWMFDPRQPKEFFVYPPALDTAELEVVYTAAVGVHALSAGELDPDGAETEVILLDDVYAGPLVDWILYRAYSKDAEHGENSVRAAMHLQAFTSVIGAKNATDSGADPRV